MACKTTAVCAGSAEEGGRAGGLWVSDAVGEHYVGVRTVRGGEDWGRAGWRGIAVDIKEDLDHSGPLGSGCPGAKGLPWNNAG